MSEFLRISPRIRVLPVVHGSGDYAVEVRRTVLSETFDCIAVALPPSFRVHVEMAVASLPAISVVVQREAVSFSTDWTPEKGDNADEAWEARCSYVPVDPCQPVIAALRIAMEENIAREYIDLETADYEIWVRSFPDAYALKTTSAEKFSAALLPFLPPIPAGQPEQRVFAMAARLRELETKYRSILVVCAVMEWPGIKDAYNRNESEVPEDDFVEETELCAVKHDTLAFLLGELPFISGLYERARAELDDDNNLSIDGIKQLLLTTRSAYRADLKRLARKISPQLLSLLLKYVRNLTLIDRRLTPDLYTLIVSAQQMAGDQFALHLLQVARSYPYQNDMPWGELAMGISRARLPDGTLVEMKSRLPGPPMVWKKCELKPRPDRNTQAQWEMQWNPYSHCSWPPEDEVIERFRTHVIDKANTIIGLDLARTEKFTTSLMDGLDIRETLRNWHTGNLYVKLNPPTRGKLDCVVMLFDYPADPRNYPWRVTWHAEHDEESTLGFFATNYGEELVGPGIGLATYGGAVFLFPPRHVPDIWHDRRLDFTDTLEERLVAAGCMHAESRHVVVLSPTPPGAGWRRMAKRYGKKLVHVPLGHFSQATIQQLRQAHVLNGKQIRSYAADFIRKM